MTDPCPHCGGTGRIARHTEIEDRFTAIVERHRLLNCAGLYHNGQNTECFRLLYQAMTEAHPDRQDQRLRLIEDRHIAWCAVWAKREWQFRPQLSNWLRRGGWMEAPPETKAESPEDRARRLAG